MRYDDISHITDKMCYSYHWYSKLLSPEERSDRYNLLRLSGASINQAQRWRDWSPPHFHQMLDYLCNPDRLAERQENNRLGLSEEGLKSIAVA